MLHNNNAYHFFMAATTPKGVISNFPELSKQNDRTNFLIKGPSGSGKSTLIKAAIGAVKTDYDCELIHCSADKNSLDAAIFSEPSVSFIDATPPHIIEPVLPQVKDRVISLYDFFSSEMLSKNKEQIVKEQFLEQMYSERYSSFIKAAGLLISSNERLCSRCIQKEKLSNFLNRLCSREIKKKAVPAPKLKKRFLSTITKDGIFMFTDTAKKMCDRLYAINDKFGAVSSVILEAICGCALNAGYTVYCCLCPLSDSLKIDHILIPELSLGFMTSNRFHPVSEDSIKNIHTSRFYDSQMLRERSVRTNFQHRAARELLKEAAVCSEKRLEHHKKNRGVLC